MDLTSLLFPLLIGLLVIPLFLSGRRQRKQLAETQALQSALEVGDVVVTTSGLRATVVDASYEETVDLEIADGVVTTWVRAAIREKVAAPADDAIEDVPADDAEFEPVTPGVPNGTGAAALPAAGARTDTDPTSDPAPDRAGDTPAGDSPTGDRAVPVDSSVSGDRAVSLDKGDSANGTSRS